MIAEFEHQRRVWFLWPSRGDIWRNSGIPAQRELQRVINLVQPLNDVVIGADASQIQTVRRLFDPAISVVELPYNDAWIRDTGPVFKRDPSGEIFGVDFSFNAWGGIYSPYDLDDEIGSEVCRIERIPCRRSELILEGGAITTDGQGTVITTEACVLSPSRKLDGRREFFERELTRLLDAKKIIFLPQGLANDETGGHVDQLCVFSRVGQVLLAWTEESGANYEVCRRAYEVLDAVEDANGGPLEIIKINLPPQIRMTEEESKGFINAKNSLPRRVNDVYATSYINFSFVNGGVLLPQFGFPECDKAAQEMFSGLFPDRKIIPVWCREFVLGGGAIHCLTKEVF